MEKEREELQMKGVSGAPETTEQRKINRLFNTKRSNKAFSESGEMSPAREGSNYILAPSLESPEGMRMHLNMSKIEAQRHLAMSKVQTGESILD